MRLNVLLALLPAVLGASVAKRDQPAPLIANRDVSSLIADKYIVKFKDGGLLSVLDDVLGALSIDAERQFKNAFKGFAGHLDKATLSILRDHPEVSAHARNNSV